MRWYENRLLSKIFLVTDEWNVAWKEKEKQIYHVVENPKDYWLADSMLFVDPKTKKKFLFVEAFNKKRKLGEIAVLEYVENIFQNFRIVLTENYHLSYPNVFFLKNKYYMIPESSQNNSINLYQAEKFPDEWMKKQTILEGKYVDTSIIKMTSAFIILYTYDISNQRALIIEWNMDDNSVIIKKEIDDVSNILRSAGNAIGVEDNLLLPVQYNKNMYGEAIRFVNMENLKEKDKILPEDIRNNKNKKYRRIHTYTCVDDFEAIDISGFHFECFKVIRKIIGKIYNGG